MVKKWETTIPEGVRALEKFNREHQNVLLKTGAEKQGLLNFYRLKEFQGRATGAKIDLTAYKQVFEPISG